MEIINYSYFDSDEQIQEGQFDYDESTRATVQEAIIIHLADSLGAILTHASDGYSVPEQRQIAASGLINKGITNLSCPERGLNINLSDYV